MTSKFGIFTIGFLALAAVLSFTGSAAADAYTYDQYGRLIQIVYTSGSTITYTYDAAGNRTQVVKVH